MNNDDVIKCMQKLAQLDVDAVRAYGQAIEEIDLPEIRHSISKFRDDHLRHIEELNREIKILGGEPNDYKPDLKGFLIEGFTAIRSMTGTEGALKAMKTNEKLTNKTYSDALKAELPTNIRSLIEKNYNDEKRHLAYIEEALVKTPWKEKENS